MKGEKKWFILRTGFAISMTCIYTDFCHGPHEKSDSIVPVIVVISGLPTSQM